MLIDGGKGQIRYAAEAMKELDLTSIPIIGIAERFDHIYIEGKTEPIILPDCSEALHLLQRIRDEAHRFAVSFHRSLRSKRNLRSILDDIPGIGRVRKKALIKGWQFRR